MTVNTPLAEMKWVSKKSINRVFSKSLSQSNENDPYAFNVGNLPIETNQIEMKRPRGRPKGSRKNIVSIEIDCSLSSLPCDLDPINNVSPQNMELMAINEDLSHDDNAVVIDQADMVSVLYIDIDDDSAAQSSGEVIIYHYNKTSDITIYLIASTPIHLLTCQS